MNKFYGIHTAVCWLFFFATTVFAQAPDTLWTKSYGGYYREYGYSVKQTADGSYIGAGITQSYGSGGYDIWLLRLNTNGDTLWTKTYGNQYDDYGFSIEKTNDGGYIIAGCRSNDSVTYDVWLLRTNSDGDTLWTKTYGGYHTDIGRVVQQTADGGYIIAGLTRSFGQGTPTYANVYFIKTDEHGDTLWTRIYGEPGLVDDVAYSVKQTSDGGYVICGYTGVDTGLDIYLLKTDANGNSIWARKYGGAGTEMGYSVLESNGGYIVAGFTNTFGPHPSNFYLLKVNYDGDTIWTKVHDLGNDEHGRSVQATSNGGYIIAGRTYLYGNSDVALVRTDSNGNVIWTKVFPKINHGDEAYEIQQTADNGYIIVGYTQYYYTRERAYEQLYLIKTRAETEVIEKRRSSVEKFVFEIKPNPMVDYLMIDCFAPRNTSAYIVVYNHLGQQVRRFSINSEHHGTHRVIWNGCDESNNSVPAGVYFVEYNGVIKTTVKIR